MAIKNRDVEKALGEAGWTLARQRGSHRQYRHPENPNVVTVSGKPSHVPTPGLLADLRRKTGLPLR